MNETVNVVSNAKTPEFVKKIGKITYEVEVHFSKTATETMTDKIMRIMQNDTLSAEMS